MSYTVINPESLGAPRGFSNGLLAPAGGRLLFVAGQVASNAAGEIVADGFAAQFGQALDNVLLVVREAGGEPSHVGRLTIYVTDMATYRESAKALGPVYRERMGRHFPAMALVEVKSLVPPDALVEIEATAVLPAEK